MLPALVVLPQTHGPGGRSVPEWQHAAAEHIGRELVAGRPSRYGTDRDALCGRLHEVACRVLARCAGPPDVGPACERLLNPAVVDELELMLAYRAGNADAHRDLMALHGARVRAQVVRTLGAAHLDEHVTSVFTHLWERALQFLGMSSLKTWITTVVRNWCLDAVRRSQARPREIAGRPEGEVEVWEGLASTDAPVAEAPLCREFGDALRTSAVQALSCMEPPERAILRLRYLEGLPHEALRRRRELLKAGEECLEPYTITRRVQRASKALRARLLEAMDSRGYGAADVLDLMERCQGIPSEIARQLTESE